MMGGNKKLFFYNKLKNCYLSSDYKYIILIYTNYRTSLFSKFIGALRALRTFENEIQISKGQTAYIFKVLKEYKDECKKFLEGRYSEFDSIYKLQILDFHDKDIEDSLGQILYRSPSRRKQIEITLNAELPERSELYSIPTKENEIINIKNFTYERDTKTDG